MAENWLEIYWSRNRADRHRSLTQALQASFRKPASNESIEESYGGANGILGILNEETH